MLSVFFAFILCIAMVIGYTFASPGEGYTETEVNETEDTISTEYDDIDCEEQAEDSGYERLPDKNDMLPEQELSSESETLDTPESDTAEDQASEDLPDLIVPPAVNTEPEQTGDPEGVFNGSETSAVDTDEESVNGPGETLDEYTEGAAEEWDSEKTDESAEGEAEDADESAESAVEEVDESAESAAEDADDSAESAVEEVDESSHESVEEEDFTIDLSCTITSGTGYTITGSHPAFQTQYTSIPANAAIGRTLTFNTDANGLTYYIYQSVLRSNPPSLDEPKAGTSIFTNIVIPANVDVTLVINEIDLDPLGSVTIANTGKATLLLDSVNIIRGFIIVPTGAEVKIDSFNNDNGLDRLLMPAGSSTSRNNASIGGQANGTAGTITIDGGGIEITTFSSGACIGGGGSQHNTSLPASAGGNGGNITINGGVITAIQYGMGTGATGTGYSGACIGGGGGNSVNGGNGGTIIINDGTVNVHQYTRAAGIGGGSFGTPGYITINGGVVNATVHCLAPGQFGAGEGAAIGASSGNNNSGPGYITITDGTVRAIATEYGGAGIGISNGGQPVHVLITGGDVYAESYRCAGIGALSEHWGSTIAITGGTVIAKSTQNAGIGSSIGHEPYFSLSALADVKAYSGGTIPAINTLDNAGEGYFVNARINPAALSSSADTVLNVYDSSNGALLRSLTLPANYRNFAYSTKLDASGIDKIIAKNGSTVLGIIVRDSDNSEDIYSIIARNGYNAHNGSAGNGALPVKLDAGTVRYYTVTEKYADIYGNLIDGGRGSETLVPAGSEYSKGSIPAVAGYNGKGHKWDAIPDSSGSDYTRGNSPVTEINSDRTIFFIYAPDAGIADLTVIKTVTGPFGDRSRLFTFTIYFTDDAGIPLEQGETFSFEGGVSSGIGVLAPQDGVLILDDEGKAVFQLSHGQMITIIGIPGDAGVRVVETEDVNYITSFSDSSGEDGPENNDTGFLTAGAGARSIEFINARRTAVPTGISDDIKGYVMLLSCTLLTITVFLGIEHYRRKRR